jgi:outer membrane protein assembly factor BamB
MRATLCLATLLLAACSAADLQALGPVLKGGGTGASGTTGASNTGSGGIFGGATPTGPDAAPAATWEAPPEGERFPKIAGRKWGYAAMVNIQDYGGPSPIRVDYAPDGNVVYVQLDDGSVVAWDLAAGKARWTAKVTKDFGQLAVDPHGEYIAVGGTAQNTSDHDGAVHVLSPVDGSQISAIRLHSEDPACDLSFMQPQDLQIDTDGVLFGIMDNENVGGYGDCQPLNDIDIVRFDARGGRAVWRRRVTRPTCQVEHECVLPLSSLALNPATNELASSACDGSVAFLDKATGKDARRVPCPTKQIPDLYTRFPDLPGSAANKAMTFSNDGKRLYTGFGPDASSTGAVFLYEDNATLKVLGLFPNKATRIAISPDGKLLMQESGDLLLSDIATGKLAYVAPGDHFAFNPRRREFAVVQTAGFWLYQELDHPEDSPAETDKEVRKPTPPDELARLLAAAKGW